MDISLIVAMDKRRGIGKDGRLPWHLPADLKLFKKITMGHHLIMGRKTWESIGRPLPGRTMIVLTRQTDYQPIGCLVAPSLNEGLEIARRNGEKEVFVIGGAKVFRQALPMADRIYLSRVEGIFAADAFFPELPQGFWKTVKQTVYPSNDHNPFTFIFEILEKEPIRNQD
jgi:dihydrofolate reductase